MSLLNYVTYKYVVLKDARLGLTYYILVALILLYSVVEIVFNKGYLQFDTKPQGVIRVVLDSNFIDETISPSTLQYCQDGLTNNISCRFVDALELNWPMEGRAVTITTFAKDKVQRSKVNSNSPRDEYEVVEMEKYFTQGPELALLKIDHAVVASAFTGSDGKERIADSKRNLKGFLLNVDGSVIRELSVRGKPDKVTVQELLEASGTSGLDVPSDSINSRGRSLREKGCVLRVSIFYQNWYNTWFGTSEVEYSYRVRRVPFMDYSSKEILPHQPRLQQKSESDELWRLLRKRYSIRIEFEQSGSLAMFSLPALLLKLVSGMGLLTLTATIVDTLALYLLPNRLVYRRKVFEETDEIKTFKFKKG